MKWPWALRWRFWGVDFQAHISTLFGPVVIALLFSNHLPDAITIYAALCVFHLIGHIAICMRYNLPVTGINFHAFGGDAIPTTRSQPGALIAIGVSGIGAHVLLAAIILATSFVFPKSDTLEVINQINLLLLAFNLLPFIGSDGRLLWTLLREYAAEEQNRILHKEQQHWESILAAEQHRDTLTPPSPQKTAARTARVSKKNQDIAQEQILEASLREAVHQALMEQDARADSGVDPSLVQEVQTLLEDAWSSP